MPTAQEVIDELGISDEQLQALKDEFGPAALRKELGEAKATINELKPKADNWDRQQRLPDVQKKFEDAGGDWEQLSTLERKAVEKFEKVDDADALAQFISENDLPTRGDGGGEGDEEPPPAARIGEQAERAGRDAGRSKTTIGPDDVANWSPDKIAEFQEKSPDLYEQILQGKEVVATFS